MVLRVFFNHILPQFKPFFSSLFFIQPLPKSINTITYKLLSMSKTLQIKKDTYSRLQAHKRPTDNFDTLLTRLLDKWEGFYGLS